MQQGRSVTEVADGLGINRNMLTRWKTQFEEEGAIAFPGHGRRAETEAEAEIRRLEERIRSAHVAATEGVPTDIVFLGAVVKLRDTGNGDEDLYKLVGEASGRFDADEIEVTVSSPMGEALMKARVGDVVKVDLPRGTKRFEVVEIL